MTRWTNNLGLPYPLASAIMADEYDKVGDISITGLILPPRIRQLEIRHAEEITEDVSDGIWKLIGNIGHKILERADTDNHLPEERLTAKVNGWVVSGKPDLLGAVFVTNKGWENELTDYKFTSVWAIKDEKEEWTQQLNAYAWLYRQHSFEVKQAHIVAVLRDWSKLRAAREPDNYPQVGVVVREVPLWKPDEQGNFVESRVNLHKAAEGWRESNLPLCTPEERWRKPDTWAIKKMGNKRAWRVLTEEPKLEMPIDGKPWHDYYVEHRPGTDVRCQSFCRVAAWCDHGRKVKAAMGEEAPVESL